MAEKARMRLMTVAEVERMQMMVDEVGADECQNDRRAEGEPTQGHRCVQHALRPELKQSIVRPGAKDAGAQLRSAATVDRHLGLNERQAEREVRARREDDGDGAQRGDEDETDLDELMQDMRPFVMPLGVPAPARAAAGHMNRRRHCTQTRRETDTARRAGARVHKGSNRASDRAQKTLRQTVPGPQAAPGSSLRSF